MEYKPYRPFELSFVRKLALLNTIWRNIWMKLKCGLTGETMIERGRKLAKYHMEILSLRRYGDIDLAICDL